MRCSARGWDGRRGRQPPHRSPSTTSTTCSTDAGFDARRARRHRTASRSTAPCRRGPALRQPGEPARRTSRDPIETLEVGSLGTHHTLDLARKHDGARFLLASTSEIYGDPARAPAARELLGQREPGRPAVGVRRGQALRRGDHDGVPPHATASTPRSCASSTPTARGSRPDDGRVVSNFLAQAMRRRAAHRLRRRHADPVVLLRRRRGRRPPRAARVRRTSGR